MIKVNSHFNAFLRTFIYWTYKLSYIICKHNTSEIINRKWVGISRQQPIIKTKNKTMKKIILLSSVIKYQFTL